MVQVSTENTPATPERPSLLEQLYGALVEFSHEACLLVSLEGVIGG